MSDRTTAPAAPAAQEPLTFPWSAAIEAADAVEAIEVPLMALKGVEDLLYPELPGQEAQVLRHVERGNLHALVGCIITRLHLDFEAARKAAQAAQEVASQWKPSAHAVRPVK